VQHLIGSPNDRRTPSNPSVDGIGVRSSAVSTSGIDAIAEAKPRSTSSANRKAPSRLLVRGYTGHAATDPGSLRGDQPRPASLCGGLEASQPDTWWSGRRQCLWDRVLLSSAVRNRFGPGLACRAAILDRDSPGSLGDFPPGVFFVRSRDLARDVTRQVDPWRAGRERRPVFGALGVLLEQALDLWLAHLRVPADNLIVYADLEGPAIRPAEATRVQLGEQVDALVHSGSLSRRVEINAPRRRSVPTIWRLPNHMPHYAKARVGIYWL